MSRATFINALLVAATIVSGPAAAQAQGTGGRGGPPPGAVAGKPWPNAIITNYFAATVTAPPAEIVSRFTLDTAFYKKFISANGLPLMSSALVPDEAMLVGRDIIVHMLSKRPDLRQAMIEAGYRVGIMATTEMTTDVPEQRNWKKPALDDRRLTDGERERYNQPGGIGSMTDQEYWNRRARGMGGRYSTGAEENVLGYPGTRYFGEHILVHEFSHGIHSAVRLVDKKMADEIQAAYDAATAKKMYLNARGGRHYAVNTVAEYWAEGTQWWFWNNYAETFVNPDTKAESKVFTPDEFKAYDPTLYEILSRVYPDNRIPMDVYRIRNANAAAAGEPVNYRR
jgi:hypothetical protein